MAKQILVRVDALHRWGLAHAVRLSQLTKALGGGVELAVLGEGELEAFFPGARRVGGFAMDGAGLRDAVKAERPDMVLVDNPAFEAGDWDIVASLPAPVAVVNDYGGKIRGDIVINGTVLPDYHRYPAQRPGGRVLSGADYALISPHFAAHPWCGAGSRSLVIVAGGGERATRWALSIARHRNLFAGWNSMSMVVGRSYPEFEELTRCCGEAGISLHRHLPSADLAEKLSQAEVALVTGGMIVYECLALGVPTVIFPQERNLVAEGDWFAAQGAVVNLTYDGGEDMARAAAAVADLRDDRRKSAALAACARSIVDGRGMERAAAALRERLGLKAA